MTWEPPSIYHGCRLLVCGFVWFGFTESSCDWCCLFDHCAGRNATSLGRLRWDGKCCGPGCAVWPAN